MSDARSAAIEAMARAMCAADGRDWDEARLPNSIDGGTEAEVYALLADEALDALRSLSPEDRAEAVSMRQVGWYYRPAMRVSHDKLLDEEVAVFVPYDPEETND